MANSEFITVWGKFFGAKGPFDYMSLNRDHILCVSLQNDGFLVILSNGEKILAMYDEVNLDSLPIDKNIVLISEEWKRETMNLKEVEKPF